MPTAFRECTNELRPLADWEDWQDRPIEIDRGTFYPHHDGGPCGWCVLSLSDAEYAALGGCDDPLWTTIEAQAVADIGKTLGYPVRIKAETEIDEQHSLGYSVHRIGVAP